MTISGPPQTDKNPDNSNLLHMFNNNTYTDFGTAFKHVLIPSYYLSDLTEPTSHKTER